MHSLFVTIGIAGVVLVLLAYGLLSTGKLSATDSRYLWLNLVGTIGILLSLFMDWNLAGVVTQCVWIAVSIAGLWRAHRLHKKAQP